MRCALRYEPPGVAQEWLGALEHVIDTAATTWDLEPLEIVDGGYCACCVRCRAADGRSVALKVCPPRAPAGREARALRHWRHANAARLIGFDERTGALLLNWVQAAGRSEDATVADWAALIGSLHAAGPLRDGPRPRSAADE